MFYLGIDGGGTKTRCALGNESSTLATSMTGGSNVVRLGEAQARDAIHAAVCQACDAAMISPSQIDRICMGAAGAARPEIAAKLRAILAELTPATVEVVGDMVIALESAFGDGPGVIAISGTGSIVWGRDTSGNTARAGGWGFAISDEGSGHWIGRQAVAAILHAHDEDKKTLLTDLVLHEWSLTTLDELVQKANSVPPPDFPRLFRLVLQASEQNDPAACALLTEGATHLSTLASAVICRLTPHPPYVPVATTGSVFRQSNDIRNVFYNSLQTSFPGIEIRPNPAVPVEGALARARRLSESGSRT
jgi:N-acetylglucosamine kinase-like BadF-type ATPase